MKNRIVFLGAIVLGALLTAAPAWAIVNVLPTGKGKDGLSGKLSTSVTWRTGNTELLQLAASSNASFHKGPHGVLFKAQVTYGSKSSEVYIARTFEHLRYRYEWLDWLTFETLFQHQYDMFKQLKFRALLGGGFATQWQPLEDLSLVFGSTYLLEREVEGDDVEITLSSFSDFEHRWSNYLQVGWNLTETIGLKSTTFVQPKFTDFGDLRIHSENGLTVKANESFGITVSFTASYDSQPFADVEPLDTNLKTSLDFTF